MGYGLTNTLRAEGIYHLFQEWCQPNPPVKFKDGWEVLRILVKEILWWISRHKLVAEGQDSLFEEHHQAAHHPQYQHQVHHYLNGRGPHEFSKPGYWKFGSLNVCIENIGH